ncbi:hypothetical protein [Prosthecomicrobium sp. N25]|uniref:hypothetical protein n=1 Tax=Prosthecomicrobium sp. N25 TaxID=3129254 RepID=UPI0030788CE0
MTSRALRLTGGIAAATVLLAAGLAGAQAVEKTIDRDYVRRALLDTCVYTENSRKDADKMKIVDACQCAAQRVMRGVKDPDLAGLTESSRIPDAWMRELLGSVPACAK